MGKELQPVVRARYPLSTTSDAHRRMEAGRVFGKIVLSNLMSNVGKLASALERKRTRHPGHSAPLAPVHTRSKNDPLQKCKYSLLTI
ncbi:zinc-binding dehydrogenase [Rhizobium multihospitium]|uniref:zinc-binding dehydrogenase n=1 Tax=Rhizobium multihospitium TaxID=410764 RepID=UPI001FDA1DDE|nr:zinc-binding dehydrogenase [Rhizobium multihospitium]